MAQKTNHLRGDNGKRTTSIYVSKRTLEVLDVKAHKKDMSRNKLIANILDEEAVDTER